MQRVSIVRNKILQFYCYFIVSIFYARKTRVKRRRGTLRQNCVFERLVAKMRISSCMGMGGIFIHLFVSAGAT